MQPQWFYHLAGRDRGPVTIAELRRLLKSNRLQLTDSVRFINDERWMLVSEFLAAVAEPSAPTADEVVPDVDLNDHQRFEYVAEFASYPQKMMSWCYHALSGAWSGLYELVSGLSILWWKALFATTIAVLVIVFGIRFFLVDVTNEKAVPAQMLQIANELDLLQGRSTSPAEWQDFQEQATAVLAPLQQSLEVRAKSAPRVRDHYWTESGYRQSVARSHLIQAGKALFILINSRGGDDSHFQRRIAQAKEQLSGRYPRPPVRPSNWDPEVVGFIVFDVILALGGAIFWLVRRSKAVR